ncbi:hypothetical protein JB92DRAFT_3177082 [Gautieria morchelliformis]|nr:hypothetical protein JB92DRAFT_3177082 [Gautieria morchelliformis]
MYAWSDPTTLDQADVLDTMALYYLTRCFPTSVMSYHQSKKDRDEMTLTQNKDKWKPYEIGVLPWAYIKAVGPLVFYKECSIGGHFPALDNPDGLVQDLHKFIGKNWQLGLKELAVERLGAEL